MTYATLETVLQQGVAVIWLNRPDVRNAMSAELIAELTDAVGAASDDPDVRAIVLAGRGSAFCAGADLNWMKRAASYGAAENEADAGRLAALLRAIAESPKPTVARVHGPAFAGGLGLVAACDVAIASIEDASFCLTEVRIGLIPAMISPYVLRAIGPRLASRYMLSAEVFDAAEAYRIGLVQGLAPTAELDASVNALLGRLLVAGPRALAATKALIRDVAGRPVDDALMRDTAGRIAAARAGEEGREGIASFLEKRKPAWHPERD
ncbi:MAG TPA: enoyl-CoA hydratase/isomerase family protein [Burkholderiaceae bacterium]|nr:enoyl-CoA hydratase/isomerase family protein [Burkholderiaceae bacterium]